MPLFCQIVDHKYVKCGLSYLNVLYILKDNAKSLLLIWKNYVKTCILGYTPFFKTAFIYFLSLEKYFTIKYLFSDYPSTKS